jgi:hypothetical protein
MDDGARKVASSNPRAFFLSMIQADLVAEKIYPLIEAFLEK